MEHGAECKLRTDLRSIRSDASLSRRLSSERGLADEEWQAALARCALLASSRNYTAGVLDVGEYGQLFG